MALGTDSLSVEGANVRTDSATDKKLSQCPRRFIGAALQAKQAGNHSWTRKSVNYDFPTCNPSLGRPHVVYVEREGFHGRV